MVTLPHHADRPVSIPASPAYSPTTGRKGGTGVTAARRPTMGAVRRAVPNGETGPPSRVLPRPEIVGPRRHLAARAHARILGVRWPRYPV